MEDYQQLLRLYQEHCQYHVNPPSYNTWLKTYIERKNEVLKNGLQEGQEIRDVFLRETDG